ncbi:MAG: RHS repeat-associated core domain-containing protein [Anaerolineae bacterium]
MREVSASAGDVVYYLHTDHLGSVSLVTDADGGFHSRQLFLPYGDTRSETGTLPTDFGFTGQRHVPGTGLLFMHARYYHARLGRFTQADTVVPEPADPQDLNRYAYAANDPVLYTDPTGHRECGPACQYDATSHKLFPCQGTACLNQSGPELVGVAREHPAVAWGLDEDSIKTFMIEDWLLQRRRYSRGEARFGPDDPTTRLLRQDQGVVEARDKYYATGCQGHVRHPFSPGKWWSKPFLEAFYHFWVAGEVVLKTPDSQMTLRGTIGSYSVQIDREGDELKYKVRNTTNWESGTRFLHTPWGSYSILPSGVRNWLVSQGIGSDITEIFYWTEPVQRSLCVDVDD